MIDYQDQKIVIFDSWSNTTITNEELKKNNIIIVKNWYDVENVLKNRYGGLEDAVD